MKKGNDAFAWQTISSSRGYRIVLTSANTTPLQHSQRRFEIGQNVARRAERSLSFAVDRRKRRLSRECRGIGGDRDATDGGGGAGAYRIGGAADRGRGRQC